MRPALLTVPLATLALAAGGAWATPAPEPEVSCDTVALRTRTGAEDGYRILLGAVAIPGERHLARNAGRTSSGTWPYFRSAGFAVRGDTFAVSVSVPEGWRDRVAVAWGDIPASSSLRFAPCSGAPARVWNVYAGGFHLRSAGDCVPVVVRVGGVSTTVRVGIGRACGAGR